MEKELLLQDILLKMKYNPILTLSEQKPDNLMMGQSDNPIYTGKAGGAMNLSSAELSKGAEAASKQMAQLRKDLGLDNPHTWLTIGQIAVFLIPGIGTAIALGINLGIDAVDTAMYWNEGDKEMAGLSVLFSLLPFVGEIPGVQQFSKSIIKSTKDKLIKVAQGIKNISFTPQEIKLANFMKTNAQQITNVGSRKITLNLSKNIKAPKLLSVIKAGGKFSAELGAYDYVANQYHNIYQSVQSDTPKAIAEKMGYDWEEIKMSFMSSGSDSDNLKLKMALEQGWKPGDEIPENLQTNKFKKAVDDYLASNQQ
jgi:hypothetical protein